MGILWSSERAHLSWERLRRAVERGCADRYIRGAGDVRPATAREAAVLALDEHARVQEHVPQDPRLALREAKGRDGFNPLDAPAEDGSYLIGPRSTGSIFRIGVGFPSRLSVTR